jgi:hypothetical protein
MRRVNVMLTRSKEASSLKVRGVQRHRADPQGGWDMFIHESGQHFPVLISAWYGLFAPKGSPKEIVSQLNAAAVEALADPAVRSRLVDLGSLLSQT